MNTSSLKVLEIGGIGPVQFAGRVLADLGADVTRVVRPTSDLQGTSQISPGLDSGKKIAALDLKSTDGRSWLNDNLPSFQVVLEGLIPGALDRLGLGAEVLAHQYKVEVLCSIRGWNDIENSRGGHDLNYLASSGILDLGGEANYSANRGRPFPANTVGDFGGAGMAAAVGVLDALYKISTTSLAPLIHVQTSIEGAASYLTTMIATEVASAEDGVGGMDEHFLSGRAPFYRTYDTPVGEIAIAAVEAKFWMRVLETLDLDDWAALNPTRWEECSARVAERLVQMSDEQLADLLDLPCVNRVSTLAEAGSRLWESDLSGIVRPRPPISLTPYPRLT